jgi:hypothetical protein
MKKFLSTSEVGAAATLAAGDADALMPAAVEGVIPATGESPGTAVAPGTGEIPGAVGANVAAGTAGLVPVESCGGVGEDASGGGEAGCGCAKEESASAQKQKQTVSDVFISEVVRLDAMTGSFYRLSQAG